MPPRSRSQPASAQPDLFGGPPSLSAQRLRAHLAATLIADGRGFVTRPVPKLEVTLEGIPGDRHNGHARPADSRVPWYPRGTPIRNSRQLSLVSPDELAEIARRLGIAELPPQWIGANLVIEGVPRLTQLPPGTRLHFEGGAALVVEGENHPCRLAGAQVARSLGERDGANPAEPTSAEIDANQAAQTPLDLAFVTAGAGLRGLVAWVERAGELVAGTSLNVKVPPQHLWSP